MRHYNNHRGSPGAFPVRTLLAGLLSLLLPLLAVAAPAPDDIVVVTVKGEVQVTAAGATQAARAGSILDLPSAIRTGRDGSIDLRQGDTTIGVGPDTQLDFPAPAAGGGAIDRVVQPGGNAYYNVGPRGKDRLRVETPYLVAVIKGTQFNVAVAADSSTISLHEGRLEVLATEAGIATVELNAGEVAIRKRGEKTIRVLRVSNGAAPSAASAGNSGDDDDGPVAALVPSGQGGQDPGIPGDGSFGPGHPDLPASPVEGGVTVDVGAGIDGLGDIPIGADIGIEAGIDLSAGAVGAGVDAGIDLGAVGADVDADVGVDLGAGTVDVGLDAGLDLGPASVDAGVGAGVDLGAGTVDVAADAGIDLGPAGVDVAADAGVDLGAGTVDAGLDAGVDLGAGVGADLGADAGVDAGAGTVDATVDADVAGADVGLDVGIDLTGADAGVDIGVGVLGTDINLGLGGHSPGSDVASAPETDGLGGLLGGLLGRPPR